MLRWIKRIFFTLAMPFTILGCIEVFNSATLPKTVPIIILNILLLLLTIWNLVFYFISRCEKNGLLTTGLVVQIIISITMIALGAEVHAISICFSAIAFLIYLEVTSDSWFLFLEKFTSWGFKLLSIMIVLCLIAYLVFSNIN